MLSVRNLSASFHTRAGIVRAVRNVSFDVAPGETLGIVGESGSGKSVTCYSMMGLIPMPPGRIESGSAMLDGTDLLRCPEKELRAIRGKRISMIFQDPMTSLNPYLTIGEQVAEPLVIHEGAGKKEARVRALEQLALAGIPDAEQRMDAYPHQFSGGMRQRVMIAMALITRPEILIADEPTPPLTSLSRSRCWISSENFSRTWVPPSSLSHMTSAWCANTRTASTSCMQAASWKAPRRRNFWNIPGMPTPEP